MSDSQTPVVSPAPEVPAGELAHVPPPQQEVVSTFEQRLIALWYRPKWLAPLAILGCLGAAATWVLSNDPTDTKEDPLGPCVFRAMTGLDCPGCGGTRMVWSLLHGDIVQAARYHLMALLAVPVILWAYLAMVADRIGKFRIPTVNIPLGVFVGYLIMCGVFVVGRNLPWEPFSSFHV